MNLELLISIIALQKQTINKTEYKISIMKLKKLVTFLFLFKENERNKIAKQKYIRLHLYKSRVNSPNKQLFKTGVIKNASDWLRDTP